MSYTVETIRTLFHHQENSIDESLRYCMEIVRQRAIDKLDSANFWIIGNSKQSAEDNSMTTFIHEQYADSIVVKFKELGFKVDRKQRALSIFW